MRELANFATVNLAGGRGVPVANPGLVAMTPDTGGRTDNE